MSDLLVSLAESLAGAAAAAAERRRARVATPTPSRPQPQPRKVVVPAVGAFVPEGPGRDAAAVAVARPREPAPTARRLDVRQLIDSPQSLLRSVVAGEILGRPAALRSHNLWDGPSV